jgi:ABC-type polysaccharide/polyol phosphate transport system ATPase subunit
VEPEGGGQTERVFEDKDEAIRQATEQACAGNSGQIVVHGRVEYAYTYYEYTHGEGRGKRKGQR